MGVCAACDDSPESGRCPVCGRPAAPSLTLGGSGDDGELEISRGGKMGSDHGPSAYAGGGMGVGDDPFADDAPDGTLELEALAPRLAARAPLPAPAPAPPPEAPAPPPAAPVAAMPPPLRAPDPAAMIARYPDPPSSILETPLYAIRVLWRQFELRQDLVSLRRRRSPDVPLYERALGTHDAKTFALGLVLTGAAFFVASVLFFLPVILRYVRTPD